MSGESLSATTTSLLLSERVVLPLCELEVLQGPDRGKQVTIEQGRMVLGSAPTNPLVLTDPHVSREHLVIERTVQGYRVKDLGSTNGTTIGALRVLDALLLGPTELCLGNTIIRFTAKDKSIPVLPHERGRLGQLIGHSGEMRLLFSAIEQIAPLQTSVLILGETGVGKEVVARELHRQSTRADGPFVAINCASIPEALFESELFGHKKGAFTGAVQDRKGAFEQAHKGTLFLDEIGELPLSLQAKLLRALESCEICPLGSTQPIPINFRLLAATHRNLYEDAQEDLFRIDLFYRLAVVELEIPPLRKRVDDIGPLGQLFLQKFADEHPQLPKRTLSEGAKAAFRRYDWPGNVRELRNAVYAAASISTTPTIEIDALPARVRGVGAESDFGQTILDDFSLDQVVPEFKDAKLDFERSYLERLLASCADGGRGNRPNISEASRKSGIDRRHLHRLLKKHGL